MSASSWTQKVFRLRGLPSSISSPRDAANLLGETLTFPPDQISIYSLATASDQLEPMSKVATVQFKSIPPPFLDSETSSTEWTFPIPASLHNKREALILDTHFEGMTVLNDAVSEKHCADCIAISGLASHPFGSWQPHGPDKSFMWIRDELPRSMPGVRAVLYGYDSHLIGSSSFQSISDIAAGLIWNLKAGSWNLPSSRPIIFLAHSLGGIVLKEAILQIANSGDMSVASILDNLLGAIMFGVPSLGMEQSHLMAMVEDQANEKLVKDLSRNSIYVHRLDEAFKGLSIVHSVKIFWAYETKESPTIVKRSDGRWCKEGPLAILVNTDSATCHFHSKDKSLTIPINKDHSNMVKFSRRDNDLSKIIFSLKELFKDRLGQPLLGGYDASQGYQTHLEANIDSQSTSEGALSKNRELLIDLGSLLTDIQEIHDGLYLPELDYRITQIEDPFQNTFKWIFDLDHFTRWLREGSGLFWINGKPGSGKSTLMKYIFQSQLTEDLLHDWRKSSLDIKAGFFFHYRGTAMQKSFEGVLRSLIIQVLQPHRLSFQKQYQKTWETYQHFEKRARALKKQMDKCKQDLDDVIAMKALRSSERDLEKQLKRAMDDTGSEAKKKQTIRDIKQQLSQVRNEMEAKGEWSTDADLNKSQSKLQLQINQLQTDIAVVSQSISLLAKDARPFLTHPETKLLRSIMAESRNDSSSHIFRLERILSLLLDQDILKIDLVLFFDALDEFDGHLDKMGGFLKSLVKTSGTSATRVKVCFSSRPWKKLNDHFAKYPGFRLQDHTKADIEQYATGSLARSETMDTSQKDKEKMMKILPSIIARANGVFLWVRLAMKELFDTIAENPGAELSGRLEEKLKELPTDLFEFYKHIIDRISDANRRYTFALLELLARQAELPATATDVWGAVLTSDCTTFQESIDALQNQSVTYCNREKKVANDISAWGGGLVEIKAQDHIQLMHQTVLEFTMDLQFKWIVLGHVAAILNENGHSFCFKYWVAKISLGWHLRATNTKPQVVPVESPQVHAEETKEHERKLAAYHAGKFESTTGISQLEFIKTVPISDLQRLLCMWTSTKDDNTALLALASSYGLTLCLREWIAQNPDELQRISFQRVQPPLLASIAFEQASGVVHEGQLDTACLLLEYGYSLAKDTEFFPRLLEKIWEVESKEVDIKSDFKVAIVPAMQKLATLVLDHGQNPNAPAVFACVHPRTCTPLHVASPCLAAELIRCNANVNRSDSRGQTPLDWVLKPPHSSLVRSCAQRYEKCCLLVNAGGVMSITTPDEAWTNALAEFDKKGYDTHVLRSKNVDQLHKVNTPLQVTYPPLTSTQHPAALAPDIELIKDESKAQDSRQNHLAGRSFLSRLSRRNKKI